MSKKVNKSQITAFIIIVCFFLFFIGIANRYSKSHKGLNSLEGKNLKGFIVLEISNVVKAGLWKIDLEKLKTEMIAKNSMNLFKKGDKSRKRYLDPDFSPDGRIIAFTLEFQGQKSVALMLGNGEKERGQRRSSWLMDQLCWPNYTGMRQQVLERRNSRSSVI